MRGDAGIGVSDACVVENGLCCSAMPCIYFEISLPRASTVACLRSVLQGAA